MKRTLSTILMLASALAAGRLHGQTLPRGALDGAARAAIQNTIASTTNSVITNILSRGYVTASSPNLSNATLYGSVTAPDASSTAPSAVANVTTLDARYGTGSGFATYVEPNGITRIRGSLASSLTSTTLYTGARTEVSYSGRQRQSFFSSLAHILAPYPGPYRTYPVDSTRFWPVPYYTVYFATNAYPPIGSVISNSAGSSAEVWSTNAVMNGHVQTLGQASLRSVNRGFVTSECTSVFVDGVNWGAVTNVAVLGPMMVEGGVLYWGNTNLQIFLQNISGVSPYPFTFEILVLP